MTDIAGLATDIAEIDFLPPDGAVILSFDAATKAYMEESGVTGPAGTPTPPEVELPLDGQIRFQAVRGRGAEEELSEWSGWFSVRDIPISLTWASFNWGGHTLPGAPE